jgi:serine/threonine protein kinase
VTIVANAVIGGRYRLADRVASGGMGTVWRATDDVLDRTVAVKLMSSALGDDPTFRERFRAEARHAAALSHPNVVAVYDYGDVDRDVGDGERPDDVAAYLVMEFVDGRPLSRLLAEHGALPVADALSIVAQIARGLAAAHEAGLVHRDVKPANIIVTDDGLAKLTDFGIAAATNGVPLTATGVVLGSAHYMSPEQAVGRAATAASDVYALGLIAYECLSGARAFAGEHPAAVALRRTREDPQPLPVTIPSEVRALVERCLRRDPRHRLSGAAELAAAAESLRDRLPESADEPAPTLLLPLAARRNRPGRWGPARRRAVLAAVTAATVALVAAAASRIPGGDGRSSVDRGVAQPSTARTGGPGTSAGATPSTSAGTSPQTAASGADAGTTTPASAQLVGHTAAPAPAPAARHPAGHGPHDGPPHGKGHGGG